MTQYSLDIISGLKLGLESARKLYQIQTPLSLESYQFIERRLAYLVHILGLKLEDKTRQQAEQNLEDFLDLIPKEDWAILLVELQNRRPSVASFWADKLAKRAKP